MKKSAVNRHLLQVLVSVYNQSIQTYYHFPEVIICGHQRLDEADFQQLLNEGYIAVSSYDTFGKNYRLSAKGEAHLFRHSFRRRHKLLTMLPAVQGYLPLF